jgi:protoporphyrinogen oxidase
VQPTALREERAGVVIVGAGIAGLSAAWALERAGLRDFLLLDLEDEGGGTSASGQNPVSAYPWGAHYVPVPPATNRALIALLEEVGAVTGRDAAGRPVFAEDMLCRAPQERLFFRGQWYEGLYPRTAASHADVQQRDAFERQMRAYAARRDARGRRAFDTPRAQGSSNDDTRALDQVSMDAWLRAQGFDSPRLRWYVEYACRDDFGANLTQTSAWAGVHYFASRLETAEGEPAEFLTWPEGNARLVRHLSARAGARLRTGALVTALDPRPAGVAVTYLDTARDEGVRLHAEQVICALPRYVAARLVVPWRAQPPAFASAVEYGTWVVANLSASARPASHGFPLAWDNVLYDSPSLGYVTATHQLGLDHGPTVLTWYLADTSDDVRAARERLLAASWETLAEAVLADLERAHPDLRELLTQLDVWRWGHAMVRPRPGSCWSPALAAAARPLGRLHFAHTDLSGFALFEEAQYWGVRAAEAVLGQRAARFSSWFDE